MAQPAHGPLAHARGALLHRAAAAEDSVPARLGEPARLPRRAAYGADQRARVPREPRVLLQAVADEPRAALPADAGDHAAAGDAGHRAWTDRRADAGLRT